MNQIVIRISHRSALIKSHSRCLSTSLPLQLIYKYELISCLFLSLKKKKTTTSLLNTFTDHSVFQTYNIVISKQHFYTTFLFFNKNNIK